MARDFNRRHPVAQTQANTRVDWSNPLARDLVCLITGGSSFIDQVFGLGTEINSFVGTSKRRALIRKGFANPAWNIASGGQLNLANDVRHDVIADLSIVWIGAIGTLATNTNLVTKANGTGNTAPYAFYIVDSGGAVRMIRGGASYRAIHTASSLLLTNGVPAVLGITCGPEVQNVPTFYRDGARYTGSVSSSNTGTGPAIATTRPVAIGASPAGITVASDNYVEFCAIWKRQLTDAEHALVARRPYDLLSRRPFYYPVPDAAPGFNPAWAVGSNQYLGGGLHA